MVRNLTIWIAVLGLLTSCSKESDSETSETNEEKRTGSATRSAASGGDKSRLGNSYVERNWAKAEEVENEWTEEFKEAKTPDEKLAVVERKQASGPELLAPLIRLSLRDPNERVRSEAVKMLTSYAGLRGRRATPGVGGPGVGRPGAGRPGAGRPGAGRPGAETPGEETPGEETPGEETSDVSPPGGEESGSSAEQDPAAEVVDLVLGAVHDPSSEVRILAMEAVLELMPELQIDVFRRTIDVPEYDVRKMTITELGRTMSKPAFEVLIGGLQNPDPDFQQEVNTEINLLVHRRFESYEGAQAWWDKSAGRFSDNMIEIGGSE